MRDKKEMFGIVLWRRRRTMDWRETMRNSLFSLVSVRCREGTNTNGGESPREPKHPSLPFIDVEWSPWLIEMK